MNREAHAGCGPRKRALGIAAGLLTALVAAVVSPGGALAVVGPTDLALTKSDAPDPVSQGSNLTYTIQVPNQGANDASGVVVTDTLPKEVDFGSAIPSSGTCQESKGVVTCNLGQLNAGVTATVTIVVRAKNSGTISNTASVASPNDTNAANNQDSESTLVTKRGGPAGKASCAAPTISGTPGNDVLVGTPGPDVIRGFAGDDQISSLDGKDLVCADLGADIVNTGPRGDTAIGGLGPDLLAGAGGGDTLKGKRGRDRLRGKRGNDLLNGGRNRDGCKGGPGNDVLRRCP
jgi:uncharacterized repeat protein (TIGR01451 family)